MGRILKAGAIAAAILIPASCNAPGPYIPAPQNPMSQSRTFTVNRSILEYRIQFDAGDVYIFPTIAYEALKFSDLKPGYLAQISHLLNGNLSPEETRKISSQFEELMKALDLSENNSIGLEDLTTYYALPETDQKAINKKVENLADEISKILEN